MSLLSFRCPPVPEDEVVCDLRSHDSGPPCDRYNAIRAKGRGWKDGKFQEFTYDTLQGCRTCGHQPYCHKFHKEQQNVGS